MPQPLFDFNAPFDPSAMTVAPSVHPQARETSALAAIQIQPKRASQNVILLALFREAGERGLSDPEIQRLTGWERSTICARRGMDLKDLVEPAETRDTRGRLHYTRWKLIGGKAAVGE